MEKMWFLYVNQVVSGPFTTDEVRKDVTDGKWTPDGTQIWWKGQKEWITLSHWMQHLNEIMLSNKKTQSEAIWYSEYKGQQTGPSTKSELIAQLKNHSDIKNIRLWTVGLNHWANLFEFHEIIEKLGISKRVFDRAPIVGHVSLQRNGQSLNKSIGSVSGGGLGIKDASDLIKGELLPISIHSPLLVSPVRATAKVMYVEPNGFAGLQFENIHIESKTTLMDYVKQFKTDSHVDLTTGDSSRKAG